MAFGIKDIDQAVTPVDEHQDMWFPLETASYLLSLHVSVC